jgi:hypothetical protein
MGSPFGRKDKKPTFRGWYFETANDIGGGDPLELGRQFDYYRNGNHDGEGYERHIYRLANSSKAWDLDDF